MTFDDSAHDGIVTLQRTDASTVTATFEGEDLVAEGDSAGEALLELSITMEKEEVDLPPRETDY